MRKIDKFYTRLLSLCLHLLCFLLDCVVFFYYLGTTILPRAVVILVVELSVFCSIPWSERYQRVFFFGGGRTKRVLLHRHWNACICVGLCVEFWERKFCSSSSKSSGSLETWPVGSHKVGRFARFARTFLLCVFGIQCLWVWGFCVFAFVAYIFFLRCLRDRDIYQEEIERCRLCRFSTSAVKFPKSFRLFYHLCFVSSFVCMCLCVFF